MKKLIALFSSLLLIVLSTVMVAANVPVAPVIPLVGFSVLTIASYFAYTLPNTLFSGFITQGSEFNGKENEEIILRPIFTGTLPTEMGIKVILTVKSTIKLTFFGTLSKILKGYIDGFQGGASAPQQQKKFTLAEFKAESEYSKQDYKNTILENVTNVGGVKQNDIQGTDVFNAEVRVFMDGVSQDIFRIFWLGDLVKKTVVAGFNDDSAPDVNYNKIDGIWTALFEASSILPNGAASALPAIDQVKRIVIANGAAAQDSDWTVTGFSGTLSLTINNVAYTEAGITSADVTAANWVASHAATLLALGIVATDGGTAIISLLADVAGTPFSEVDTSTTISASKAVVTANTGASALAADEAETTMRLMLEGAPKVMKTLPKGTTRLYVTDTVIENYQVTLESDGTEQAHKKVIDGIERFTYRGIPLIPMGIDQFIDADFISAFPHRILWTTPQNLVLVLNGRSDFGETKFWFNPDENKNRQRTQFEFGADFMLPEWTVVGY